MLSIIIPILFIVAFIIYAILFGVYFSQRTDKSNNKPSENGSLKDTKNSVQVIFKRHYKSMSQIIKSSSISQNAEFELFPAIFTVADLAAVLSGKDRYKIASYLMPEIDSICENIDPVTFDRRCELYGEIIRGKELRLEWYFGKKIPSALIDHPVSRCAALLGDIMVNPGCAEDYDHAPIFLRDFSEVSNFTVNVVQPIMNELINLFKDIYDMKVDLDVDAIPVDAKKDLSIQFDRPKKRTQKQLYVQQFHDPDPDTELNADPDDEKFTNQFQVNEQAVVPQPTTTRIQSNLKMKWFYYYLWAHLFIGPIIEIFQMFYIDWSSILAPLIIICDSFVIIMSLYTHFQLKKFKSIGYFANTVVLWFRCIIPYIYLFIVPIVLPSYNIGAILGYAIDITIFCILNLIYFKKRKHLFINK